MEASQQTVKRVSSELEAHYDSHSKSKQWTGSSFPLESMSFGNCH